MLLSQADATIQAPVSNTNIMYRAKPRKRNVHGNENSFMSPCLHVSISMSPSPHAPISPFPFPFPFRKCVSFQNAELRISLLSLSSKGERGLILREKKISLLIIYKTPILQKANYVSSLT